MKFSAVIIALAAATAAVAGPVAFEAREESTSVELNDIDAVAIDYLVRRGIVDESALERGIFSGSTSGLQITFKGSATAIRKKAATTALKKTLSKADQTKFSFCDVAFVKTNLATYNCFPTSKKVGKGPSGALKA